MKTKLFSRSIAMLLCLSLLFAGFAIPASTTTISNSVASSDEFKIDENITKDDDQVVFEKKPISSDDIAISNESMILKYVDSSQLNEAKHTQRLTELEELNTYVFDNVDGTRSVYVMHENVKYIDENGRIKEKDVSLISKKGGFGTVQNDIELLIPNNPTQGIDIEYSEFAVKLIPQDLTDKISAKQTDNSIVYEKAYGEKTKLIYTPLLSGVKEDIILTEYTSDASYTFVLKTDGLNLYKNDNGYYLSKDSKADPVFYLGDIVVYDAIGKPDVGTMTVETVSAGEEYLLTVTANDDFLSDPTTVYPVTIDPSITVSENNADNSIIDAPIYQGYPDRNFATYTYNRVGTPSGNNGIGRTAVKLSGLTSQSAYQTITASQITDVTFHVREASGGSAQYINIYPLTSNTTWTETSMTWNSVGNWSTTLNCGNTMNGAQWTAFNITNLVKAWKNNTYSANAGFIMISNNESVDKSFCSSEYSSNTSYRPYVVMTYNPVISLNYSSLSIVEGGTGTLIATTQPSGQTVTWSTSNSSIATVSSTGVITAKKAGDIAIRAKIVDADGVSHYATCTVYVYIPNGVYYIKNLNSYYYLHVKSGEIANFTDVCQYPKYLDYESNQYKIRQMWKTYYLGDGRYSIRPMNKLDKGLDVTGTNVDIYDIGSSDTLSSVQSYGEWTISWYSTGYRFKNDGNDAKTMQIEGASNASEATVVASTYSTSVNCRWELIKVSSPPVGVYLYDTAKKAIVTTPTRTVNIGVTKSLSSLQLSAVVYSGTNIAQNFTWYSSNNNIATVDSNGAVTGVSLGKATITGWVSRNNSNYYISYTVYVGLPDMFSSLINDGIISATTVDWTDDGFFLTTTPMCTILANKGIYNIPSASDYTGSWYVYDYFDDWYLFAVVDETAVSYGMYKMREQESDEFDNDDPGVTISFIGLDITKITNCFNNPSDANKYALHQALVKVTGPALHAHDDVITNYFADTASDGAYLVAEKCVSFYASCFPGNVISASDNFVAIFDRIEEIDRELPLAVDTSRLDDLIYEKNRLRRIPNALEAINTAAGMTIYDFDNNTIIVQNKSNLTLYEKQAILACFTADVTFNSFAAEVEYHAEAALIIPEFLEDRYLAAIRADMAVDEENEDYTTSPYFYLDSLIVVSQSQVHGEY